MSLSFAQWPLERTDPEALLLGTCAQWVEASQGRQPSVCCSQVPVAEPMSSVILSRQTQGDLCGSDPGGGWLVAGIILGEGWHHDRRKEFILYLELPVIICPTGCQFCRGR